jgi:hypothetical protein
MDEQGKVISRGEGSGEGEDGNVMSGSVSRLPSPNTIDNRSWRIYRKGKVSVVKRTH